MPPTSRFRLLLVFLSLAPGVLSAGVHKCLDANNKLVYQDKPCQDMTSTGLSPALSRLNPQESRPRLLWKLVSGPKTLYLMGGLGYGSTDMYPLPEAVMDIFNSTQVLVIGKEFDAGDDTAGLAALTAQGSYSDGSALNEHVKAATWQRTLNLAQSLNISEETLAAQKPWMAALNLKTAAIEQAGYDQKLSVTETFVKAAHALKPIIELDPPAELVKRVTALSAAEQEAFLLKALYEADSKTGFFAALADAWKKGDAQSVGFTTKRAMDSLPASQKSAFDWSEDRTPALVEKIDQLAADGRSYFIVLDVKRLVGDKGVLEGLKAKGYNATQM